MRFILTAFILSFSILSLPGHAEDIHMHKMTNTASGVESLSPELRELLKNEMIALQKGMLSIIPSYISGNWGEIESVAHKMKNSYIMKQRLTKKQAEELHASLPEAFIKLDQNFHYLSGMLNHAAKSKKPELIGFYFSKLTESCVSCHSQFALHKFPALKQKTTTDKHTH